MTSAHRPEARGGEIGWAFLVGSIIVWDCLAPETLSNSFRRASERHPVLTIGALALTAAHLLDVLPEKVDPIQQGFKLITKRAQ